ncbi:unnamed protein product [Thelazia callipaeda]|uniref:ANK_REP_REGION domain-containing protein n=1 Tax=Thelazia callipaeda TaxID=103827 RepID=A0A0N5CSB6_THECL|nr:unnamed protein product [Thelazia callipaeda]
MTWLGLSRKNAKLKKHRYAQDDVEADAVSPLFTRKSVIEAETSEDQRSLTSITESYSRISPSSHYYTSAPDEIHIISSSMKNNKMIQESGSSHKSKSNSVASQNSTSQIQTAAKSKQSSQKATIEVHETSVRRSISMVESSEQNNYRLSGNSVQPNDEVKRDKAQQQLKLTVSSNSETLQSNEAKVDNPNYKSFALTDPRLFYANPYSSYAGAMMSPLMEMQTLSPVIYSEDNLEGKKESEKITEKTTVLAESTGAKAKKTAEEDVVLQMEPIGENVVVHLQSPVPTQKSTILSVNRKTSLKQVDGKLISSVATSPSKSATEKTAIFLRDANSHEAEDRHYVLSDSESKVLVVGAEPRSYHTDTECASTSCRKHLPLIKLQRANPIYHAVPYYARALDTSDTGIVNQVSSQKQKKVSSQIDGALQNFLLRVSISEDRSGGYAYYHRPSQQIGSVDVIQTSMGNGQQKPIIVQQKQRSLSPNKTAQSYRKHTFV